MSIITIRQATLADLEVIIPLFDEYRQFYTCPSDTAAAREFLRARLSFSESALFIARLDNDAVGFSQLYPSFSSISLARTFVLNDLFVCKQARRRGIASRLLATSVAYARSMDAGRISLSTAITNRAARALYHAAGWERNDKFYVYNFAI